MMYGAGVDSQGIILRKHFPRTCMISLLDEHYGHIKVIPCSWQRASYAVPGALVGYEIDERNGALFIEHLELMSMPACTTQSSLIFLHHMLEICTISLPVRGGQHETFDLMLEFITTLNDIVLTQLGQQVAIAKLLFASGNYPVGVDRLSVISTLYQAYADLKTITFDDAQQGELALFIYQCFAQHPAGRLLKTINFLSWDRSI